jgi:hypothetical protein
MKRFFKIVYKPSTKDNKSKIEIPFPPGIFGLLILTLIILKISTHQIDNWSWWFVLSPLIVGTLISLYYFIKKEFKNK